MLMTLQRVMVAGEVECKSGVSMIILKLSWIFSLDPLDNERSLESSSKVLKFSIVSDLSLLSSTNK